MVVTAMNSNGPAIWGGCVTQSVLTESVRTQAQGSPDSYRD